MIPQSSSACIIRPYINSIYERSFRSRRSRVFGLCSPFSSSRKPALDASSTLDSFTCLDEILRIIESSYSGTVLSTGLRSEFGELLTYSRTLEFNQLPNYVSLGQLCMNLAERMGYSLTAGPLHWTPSCPEIINLNQPEPEALIPNEDDEDDG